jgi:hypothetical protein
VVDRMCPVGSGGDVAIMPVGDESLALEEAEVVGELVAEGFVFVGVGEEEFHRGKRFLRTELDNRLNP